MTTLPFFSVAGAAATINFDKALPTRRELTWGEKIALLEQYKETKGNLNISCDYVDSVTGFNLGEWANGVRKCIFSNKQVSQLDALGFVWPDESRIQKMPWESWFQLLCDYNEEHNNPSPGHAVIFRGKKLGRWASNQRNAYSRQQRGRVGKNVSIPQHRVARLVAIGFEWRLGRTNIKSNEPKDNCHEDLFKNPVDKEEHGAHRVPLVTRRSRNTSQANEDTRKFDDMYSTVSSATETTAASTGWNSRQQSLSQELKKQQASHDSPQWDQEQNKPDIYAYNKSAALDEIAIAAASDIVEPYFTTQKSTHTPKVAKTNAEALPTNGITTAIPESPATRWTELNGEKNVRASCVGTSPGIQGSAMQSSACFPRANLEINDQLALALLGQSLNIPALTSHSANALLSTDAQTLVGSFANFLPYTYTNPLLLDGHRQHEAIGNYDFEEASRKQLYLNHLDSSSKAQDLTSRRSRSMDNKDDFCRKATLCNAATFPISSWSNVPTNGILGQDTWHNSYSAKSSNLPTSMTTQLL